MIIIKTLEKIKYITQNFYESIINALDLSQIECPYCHHHEWAVHSYYDRYVYFEDQKIRITIKRVICKHCGHTHAILLEDMVPYSIACHAMIIDIIEKNESSDSSYFFFLKKKYSSSVPDYETICRMNARIYGITFYNTT